MGMIRLARRVNLTPRVQSRQPPSPRNSATLPPDFPTTGGGARIWTPRSGKRHTKLAVNKGANNAEIEKKRSSTNATRLIHRMNN